MMLVYNSFCFVLRVIKSYKATNGGRPNSKVLQQCCKAHITYNCKYVALPKLPRKHTGGAGRRGDKSICAFVQHLLSPPFRGHAIRVAAVSPLHGIPIITTWSSPVNAQIHSIITSMWFTEVTKNINHFTWINAVYWTTALVMVVVNG